MDHHLIRDNLAPKHYVLPLLTESSGTADISRQTSVLFVLVSQFVSKQMLIQQSKTFNFCSHFLHCDLFEWWKEFCVVFSPPSLYCSFKLRFGLKQISRGADCCVCSCLPSPIALCPAIMQLPEQCKKCTIEEMVQIILSMDMQVNTGHSVIPLTDCLLFSFNVQGNHGKEQF